MYAFYIDPSIHQIGYITELMSRLQAILYTDSKTSFDIMQHDFPEITVRYFPSLRDIIEDIESNRIRVIVLQDFHYKKFISLKKKGVKFVQVFHGTSDKTYNLNREIVRYDLVCLSSSKMIKDIQRKGLNKNRNCIVTGNLKTDMIFNNRYSLEQEKKRLGLDPFKKAVLYAPTWMDGMGNSSFKKFGMRLPIYFPQKHQLIIKLHPNLHLYKEKLVRRLKENIGKRKNILFFEKNEQIYDIVPIMAASDLLITDVSGVSHEYIAFLRPMIFLNNRSLLRCLYGKNRKRIWKAGDVVHNIEELPRVIEQNLKDPSRYRAVQKEILEEIYELRDGKSVDRIIKAIRSLS